MGPATEAVCSIPLRVLGAPQQLQGDWCACLTAVPQDRFLTLEPIPPVFVDTALCPLFLHHGYRA